MVTYVDDRDRIHLLGAVQEVPKNFTDGQLRVARLADAFNDPTFTALLTAAIGCPCNRRASANPGGLCVFPRLSMRQRFLSCSTTCTTSGCIRIATAGVEDICLAQAPLPRFLSGGTPEIVDARTFLTKLLRRRQLFAGARATTAPARQAGADMFGRGSQARAGRTDKSADPALSHPRSCGQAIVYSMRYRGACLTMGLTLPRATCGSSPPAGSISSCSWMARRD